MLRTSRRLRVQRGKDAATSRGGARALRGRGEARQRRRRGDRGRERLCCGPAAIAETQEGLAGFGAGCTGDTDRDALPDAAKLASLGCGNPTAVAELHEGETVSTSGPAAASTCCSPPKDR